MQPVFERFLERLWDSVDEVDFRSALTDLASQFDLLAFAYLLLPPRSRCELSIGCPFGPNGGDWSYQASALTGGSE
ncbi:hypothetical protein MEA186_03234 [Mesorhizobium amorphae CCNWGS0123]|uniref:Uncharacterized protein n=1 Tax=Mesorhizobium amorphae CCNWGS0123 TaxID=1082933 RepID=G6Y3Z4_9HYPH|nr:hypothetical protein A6B35_31595 [Mesorhizobium amorphae CCNWGS0123]EHH13541.1 hypothetical protein MEA186_03234 [Mesorhizobium amorphae CCNWGS0123]